MTAQSCLYPLNVVSEDVQKEQYLSTVGQLFDAKEKTNKSESRIESVLLAMQRWFRALPQATKNIKKKQNYITLRFGRKLISEYEKAKDSGEVSIKLLLDREEYKLYKEIREAMS